MQRKIKGYIIHTSVYKETSLIVSLLTTEGIISFKAQAALKVPYKLAPLVQLFTYGEYTLAFSKEGNKNTLIDGQVFKNVSELSSDFESTILLSFVAESIIKDESFEKPFEVFDYCYNHLDCKDNYLSMIAIILKYHLMYNGSFLASDNCVKCGSKTSIETVSFFEGGFICSSCNKMYQIPTMSVEYMTTYRYVMKAEIFNACSFKISKSLKNSFMNNLFSFVEENTGLKFNTKQMIFDIL